jgi:hypothetical protein
MLVAWCAIAFGADVANGTYSFTAVIAVSVGVGLLLRASWSAKRHAASAAGEFRPALILIGALIVGCAVVYPAGKFGSGEAETLSRTITVICAVVWCFMAIGALPQGRRWSYCLVALMGLAGVLMIVSSPRPAIDDWYMNEAAANGLSHLRDIYTVRWNGQLPGQASNLYAYLPGSALLVWPFHVVLGDVRYGVLAALLGTSVLLIRSSATATATATVSLLGCLILLYPKALFGLEQSWIDPIVTLGLCGAAFAVNRRRPNWAMAGLILALVCKQQAWLLLPLVFVWEDFGWRRASVSVLIAAGFISLWTLPNLHAFTYDVFRYQLKLAPRSDSLSVFNFFVHHGWFNFFVQHGWQPPLAIVTLAVLVGYGIALWRLPRNAYGFLLGSAVVECMFNIASKQSFFNEWQLSASLILAAVILGPAGDGPCLERTKPKTSMRSEKGLPDL